MLAINGLLGGWLGWLFYYHGFDSPTHARWIWLAPGLWMLLALASALAAVLLLINLVQRRWKRALAWLLLVGFGIGSCAVALIPVALTIGLGTTPDIPPDMRSKGYK
jgi:peptidoglycan biosynthesis protein MviN/MurJ (putative lipid II flippase)